MFATDETNITDIELLADGRICVFGMSREVLEVLDDLQIGRDPNVRQRLELQSQRASPINVRETNHEGTTNV